jgi:hypothetical protein
MSRQMSQTMISRDQAGSVSTLDPNLPAKINLPASIRERAAAGRVTFTGPLLLVCGRSFLWMASQGLVALIFLARHHTSPWREATYWWSVCFTLADLACLAAMWRFTRREGVRIRDLFGPIRMRHGRDLFLGLGYYILVFPFFLGGGYLARRGSTVLAQIPALIFSLATPFRSGPSSTASRSTGSFNRQPRS